jgi:Ca2+-transporting ATPase
MTFLTCTLISIYVYLGLPRAISLALAFITKRMTCDNLLVRVLASCETMANANVICTDTSTLTQNSMTVVAGSVGIHAKFVRNLRENQARSNGDELRGSTPGTSQTRLRNHRDVFSLDQAQLGTALTPQLRVLLNDAICLNSSAFEDCSSETFETVFVGNKAEAALLRFAKELGWQDYKKTRDAADIVQLIPFSSDQKAMGVVVNLPCGKHRLYVKGASEILTRKCTRHVVVSKNSQGSAGVDQEIETAEIDGLAMDDVQRTIIFYANQTLHATALCYRDFESWPPLGSCVDAQNEVCVLASVRVIQTDAVFFGRYRMKIFA